MRTPYAKPNFYASTVVALSELGTCQRAKVGAMLVRNGRIISTGFNGAPAGMPHCDHDPTDPPCRVAVHAEANCIAFAARHGVATEGSVLWTTLSPCHACAQLLINAGVREVIYLERYRDLEGLRLLEGAGVRITVFSRPEL